MTLRNTHRKNTQAGGKPQIPTKGSIVFDDPRLNRGTLRFADPATRQGFTQVPNVVLRDTGLGSATIHLYSLLLSYAWQKEECFPGQDTLAQQMGYSRQQVSKLMATLKARNLISWKRQGLGRPNLYLINRLAEAYPQIVDKGAQG